MPVQIGAKPQHGFDQPLGLLGDCHRRIERFLGILEKIASQAAGQPLNDEQRRAVEAALAYFDQAAPLHNDDEEKSLFPRMRQVDDPRVHAALEKVARLESEHALATAAHAEAGSLFRRWLEDGPLDPAQGGRLNEVLAGLRSLYQEHIALEDTEIFPLAGKILAPEQFKQIGSEMAARRGLG